MAFAQLVDWSNRAMYMTPQEAMSAQDSQPLYKCAICEETVYVYDGHIFRTCDHSDAAVIVALEAILKGQGGVAT